MVQPQQIVAEQKPSLELVELGQCHGKARAGGSSSGSVHSSACHRLSMSHMQQEPWQPT